MIPSLNKISFAPTPSPQTPINNSPVVQSNIETVCLLKSLVLKLVDLGMIDKDEYLLAFTASEDIPCISEDAAKKYHLRLSNDINCHDAFGNKLLDLTQAEYIRQFVDFYSKETGKKIEPFLRGSCAGDILNPLDYLLTLIIDFLNKNGFSEQQTENIMAEIHQLLQKINENGQKKLIRDVDWLLISEENIDLQKARDLQIEFLASVSKEKTHFIRLNGFVNLKIAEPTPLFPLQKGYLISSIGNPKDEKSIKTDIALGHLTQCSLFSLDDHLLPFPENGFTVIPKSSHTNFWQMIIDKNLKLVRLEPWHIDDFRSALAAIQRMYQDHTVFDNKLTIEAIVTQTLMIVKGSEEPDKLYEEILKAILDRAKWHLEDPSGFLITCYLHFQAAASSLDLKLPADWFTAISKEIRLDLIPFLEDVEDNYQFALLLLLFNDKSGKFHAEWDVSNKGRISLCIRGFRIYLPKGLPIAKKEKLSSGLTLLLSLKTFSPKGFYNLPPRTIQLAYQMIDKHAITGKFERVLVLLALQNNQALHLVPLSIELKESLFDFLLHSDDQKQRQWLANQLSPWLPSLSNGQYSDVDWIKAFYSKSFKDGLLLWNTLKKKLKDDVAPKATREMHSFMCGSDFPNNTYANIEESLNTSDKWTIFRILLENPKTGQHIVEEISQKIIECEDKKIPDLEALVILLLNRLSTRSSITFLDKIYPRISPPTEKLSSLIYSAIQKCIFSESSDIELLLLAQKLFFTSPNYKQLDLFWDDVWSANASSRNDFIIPVLINYLSAFTTLPSTDVFKEHRLKLSVLEKIFNKAYYKDNSKLLQLFLINLRKFSKPKESKIKMAAMLDAKHLDFLKQQQDVKGLLEFVAILSSYDVSCKQDEEVKLNILKTIESRIPTSGKEEFLELIKLYHLYRFNPDPRLCSTCFLLFQEALKYEMKDQADHFNSLAIKSISTLSKDEIHQWAVKILDTVINLSSSDLRTILNALFLIPQINTQGLLQALYEKKKEAIQLLPSSLLFELSKNLQNTDSPAYQFALKTYLTKIDISSKDERVRLSQTICKLKSLPLDLMETIIDKFSSNDDITSPENSATISAFLSHLKTHGINEHTIHLWQKIIDICLKSPETAELLIPILCDNSAFQQIYHNDHSIMKTKTLSFFETISKKTPKNALYTNIVSIADLYLTDTLPTSIIAFLLKGNAQSFKYGLDILEKEIDTACKSGELEQNATLLRISELTSEHINSENLLKKLPWKKISRILSTNSFNDKKLQKLDQHDFNSFKQWINSIMGLGPNQIDDSKWIGIEPYALFMDALIEELILINWSNEKTISFCVFGYLYDLINIHSNNYKTSQQKLLFTPIFLKIIEFYINHKLQPHLLLRKFDKLPEITNQDQGKRIVHTFHMFLDSFINTEIEEIETHIFKLFKMFVRTFAKDDSIITQEHHSFSRKVIEFYKKKINEFTYESMYYYRGIFNILKDCHDFELLDIDEHFEILATLHKINSQILFDKNNVLIFDYIISYLHDLNPPMCLAKSSINSEDKLDIWAEKLGEAIYSWWRFLENIESENIRNYLEKSFEGEDNKNKNYDIDKFSAQKCIFDEARALTTKMVELGNADLDKKLKEKVEQFLHKKIVSRSSFKLDLDPVCISVDRLVKRCFNQKQIPKDIRNNLIQLFILLLEVWEKSLSKDYGTLVKDTILFEKSMYINSYRKSLDLEIDVYNRLEKEKTHVSHNEIPYTEYMKTVEVKLYEILNHSFPQKYNPLKRDIVLESLNLDCFDRLDKIQILVAWQNLLGKSPLPRDHCEAKYIGDLIKMHNKWITVESIKEFQAKRQKVLDEHGKAFLIHGFDIEYEKQFILDLEPLLKPKQQVCDQGQGQ